MPRCARAAVRCIFLLTCLPVLTAPAGWTALCRACQSLLLEENQPYRRFLNSFRANFLPSLPLGLLFFIAPVAILYGGWFYFRLTAGAGVGAVLACFCLIGSYLLWCIGALARLNIPLPGAQKSAAGRLPGGCL